MISNKKAYKQLRKKLKNKYDKPVESEYSAQRAVKLWVTQSGIKYAPTHLKLLCVIYGAIPHPYQESSRKKILKYLKRNKKYASKH